MTKRRELQICHHFIFVFSLYFFYHSSCRIKDQFTVRPVLILKFGIEDFIDPVDSHHWFVVEVLTRSDHATPILGLCHAVSRTGLFLDAV